MELSIIKSLEEKILKYKEEIQQIETAIEVIKKNTGAKASSIKTSGVKTVSTPKAAEPKTRKRRTKAEMAASAAVDATPEKETSAATTRTRAARNSSKKESSKKPVSKQVLDYLDETNRFLFPSEISGELASRTGKKLTNVKLLVNQTLSRLKKENKLISYKPEKSRSHAWGFPNWLDSDRLPEATHLPSSAE